MVVQKKPRIVSLDTNIFDKANYIYAESDLSILKQYIDDEIISQLVISDIVVRECKRHLSESAENLVDDFNTRFDSPEWRRSYNIDLLSSIPKVINKDVIENGLIQSYDEYLTATHAKILESNNIDIEKILSDYFNSVPPFKGGKKAGKKRDHKKYEFPDAIIIARLKQFAEECGEICIVSEDSDWEAAFWDCEYVKFYKCLKEMFADITIEEKVGLSAQQHFYEQQINFNNDIERTLLAKPVEVYAQIVDMNGNKHNELYDDLEILNCNISSTIFNVDYVGKSEAIITILVIAMIEIEGSFINEVFSESEDPYNEDCFEIGGIAKEFHEIRFHVQVTFEVKDEKIVETIKTSPQLPRKIILDEGTIKDRRFINIDGFHTYKKKYKCACGHTITVDLIENVEEDNHLGERGMGDEIEHCIYCHGNCPNCGKEYIISGGLFEYPIGALNSDNTKIEWKDRADKFN